MPPALRNGLLLAALSLLVSFTFWAPAFVHLHATGFGDWQQFHHWWEVGVVSVWRFFEWPLWDPHHCGGVSQWGQPQAQNWAPLYLLFALPFGTTLGHKLFLVAHSAIGFAGLYLFARRELRTARAPALLAATVWCGSGFYAWHGSGGHSTFLAFYYYPLLLLFWRWAHRDPRYCVAVALLMATLLLEGGHYPAPYAVVLLAFDSIAWAGVSRRRIGAAARTIVVAGGLTLLCGALRWVPILLAMVRHPRPIEDTDALTLAEIFQMWTVRDPGFRFPGHEWVWAEYGTYVGIPALVLGAAGVAVAIRRKRLSLVFGALLFLAFSMGNQGAFWPSALLHRVPFFSNLHVPSRWQVVCTLYMALLAALALDAAIRFARARLPARPAGAQRWLTGYAPLLLVLAIGADLYTVSRPIVDRWRGPAIGLPNERPHLVRGRRYHEEYANYPSRNVGTRVCYDAVPWKKSNALWVGDVPQVRIRASSLAARNKAREGDRLLSYHRTNHRVEAEVALAAPGRAIFNQNYESQWTTSTGASVNDRGRLAVDLPAGRHRIALRFAPDDLPWSVLASGVGLLLCAFVLRRRPNRGSR